jgi:hypothetical protein
MIRYILQGYLHRNYLAAIYPWSDLIIHFDGERRERVCVSEREKKQKREKDRCTI